VLVARFIGLLRQITGCECPGERIEPALFPLRHVISLPASADKSAPDVWLMKLNKPQPASIEKAAGPLAQEKAEAPSLP
jgi:hypothetical protein